MQIGLSLHKENYAKGTKSFVSPTRVVQKKIEIGSSNNEYEVEADWVADQVVNMNGSQFNQTNQTRALVQRKCAACSQEDEIQKKSIANSITPLIQMSSANSVGEAIASTNLTQQINSSKGGGHGMDQGTRGYMESRFGTDFSDVKIHTNSQSVQMSRDINAKAFTMGNDIYFNEGKYNPNSNRGKHLLAHELAHVVQQSGDLDGHFLQRSVAIASPYQVLEDFDPANQFKKKQRALGRSVPLLNNKEQAPKLKAKKFKKALQLPILSEKNLDEISRPDLSDSSLDPVRNNLVELKVKSFGKRVKLVQEALIAWGKGLNDPIEVLPRFGADQIFGGETKAAVEFFQDEHPILKKDGIVGDLTLAELQVEMDKLHGLIFTLEAAGHNNYTGLIHIPPPSKNWQQVTASDDEFFDNPTINQFHKNEVASKCGTSKKFNISFTEKESIIPSILKHERFHEKDQVEIVSFHLSNWDTRLRIAALLKLKFKAANKKEAMEIVFDKSGADKPKVLSKKIINAMIVSNIKLHSGPLNVVPKSHLDIPDCSSLKFSFTLSK